MLLPRTQAAGSRPSWVFVTVPSSRPRRSGSPAARRLDHENVTGPKLRRVAAAHRGHRTVGALHPVPAERAGVTACDAGRGHPSVARQRGDHHRLEEPYPPDAAVAAAPAAVAPAAAADGV